MPFFTTISQKQKAATTHNAAVPLGRLPPELRNLIYDLVLPKDGTIEFRSKSRSLLQKKSTLPAITQVCKVLRNETLPIYYGNNEIIWRGSRRSTRPVSLHKHQKTIKSFLKQMEELQLLRYVQQMDMSFGKIYLKKHWSSPIAATMTITLALRGNRTFVTAANVATKPFDVEGLRWDFGQDAAEALRGTVTGGLTDRVWDTMGSRTTIVQQ